MLLKTSRLSFDKSFQIILAKTLARVFISVCSTDRHRKLNATILFGVHLLKPQLKKQNLGDLEINHV